MKAKRLSATLVKKWARISQIVWLILIGVTIVLMITNQSLSFAEESAASGAANYGILQDWLTGLIPKLGIFVGLLAVVMVIIAGIVYAFDLGGGKQIGVAKEMIISAISGVILFMLAAWLLNAIKEIVPADSGPSPSSEESTDKSDGISGGGSGNGGDTGDGDGTIGGGGGDIGGGDTGGGDIGGGDTGGGDIGGGDTGPPDF